MKTRATLLAALTLCAASPVSTLAQQTFTLDEALSAPFPSGLVRAPSGDRIAWVQNDRGSRNVWVAEGPAFEGRQVTGYEGDDGQDMTGLQFTPDGDFVLYVRAQGSNRQGEFPNPTSEPDPAERATWVVPFSGGEPRKLLDGAGAVISPDGGTVAFTRGREIRAVSFDGSADPERLFTIRGGASSLRWSPTGDRIAFQSNRGDHGFIGVYDLESREITYLDPSVDRDTSPVWSPDGRWIAFRRTPNREGPLPFFANREGPPWSIRIGDPANGTSRELWRAAEGYGSVFQGPSQLWWAAGDRIVFPWEGTGWINYWSIPASGGEPTHLTPGEFEIQWAGLSPDRRHIVYSGNQGDIDRRHVWRVPVDGSSAPEILTPGTGVEWEPVQTASGAVAFLASSGTVPAHAEVIRPGGDREWLAPASYPSDYPSDRMVEPEPVIYRAADGMEIHAQLFLPPDLRPGERRPAAIFFHGGSRRQMLLGFHHRGYYHNAYAMNQYLANQGYVVLAVNFRSGVGYGLEFREALNYGAEGASEYNDVTGAGLYLQGRDDVDPERIGLWGGSYGGYLTAFGLARASDMFAAGVDIHGAHDWNVVINNFVPSYNPAENPELAQSMFEASPMAYVDSWRSPVLFIHGDDDRNVPFSETVDLVNELRERDVDYEQLIFPDEVHGFLLHRNWLRAYEAAADFFQRKLVNRRTISQ